jgi:predicted  nucleic acid-binding Zn-ribbon protein
MSDDISVQILAQSSENIQKLFDLSTRIDERVKAIQANQASLENRIEALFGSHNIAMQKIVVLESKDLKYMENKLTDCEKEISVLDKRLCGVEASSGQNQDRWNKIMSFVIQLVWVILAAWTLTKLHLQAPAVP